MLLDVLVIDPDAVILDVVEIIPDAVIVPDEVIASEYRYGIRILRSTPGFAVASLESIQP
jgi:hypothetical protein